ncbi:MAG: hypothetical protein HY047_01400 [Acidobacteria bacterium]|nr:hypothetical protein [Acidobacteriota bacterium]
MARRILWAIISVFLVAVPVEALDIQVKDVRASSRVVQASVELRDVVPDRFKRLIDEGGVLHVRVQTELWESRPVWDRLVYPAMIRMFRLARAVSGRDVALTDAEGVSVMVAKREVPLIVEMGDRARVNASSRYYVHVIATVGTLAEREVDEVGDAVFGRASESNGLGSLGRLVFRTALQVSDYLQSVSAETRSRKLSGQEIIRP